MALQVSSASSPRGSHEKQLSTQHDGSELSDVEKLPESAAQAEIQRQQQQPPAPFDPSAGFPEGGTKAWLTVAGSAACLFVSFGWINCVGIFQDYYQTHQLRHYSPSQISWIPTMQIFFMLFGGPYIGKIFDDYGQRSLLIGGALLHVFGLMMTSLSKEYYQIMLSQAVCSAIGASMVFYPAFTCTSTWFFKKRGMAIGLIAAGSSLGGVIFPIMVTHLIPQVGFGWTIRICAFLILVLLVFANLTVTSRVPPSPKPFGIMVFLNPLKERNFVLFTAAVFFFYWGMFLPFTFIVVEARSLGMSERLANYLVVILNAASVFGRTIPAALADRFGRLNMMILMSLLTTILLLALWLPASGNVPLVVFSALIGFSTGAGISLVPAICAHISPMREIGTRTGVVVAIAAFAALTGSPIGGKILMDQRGDFRGLIVFSGVACAVGTVLFVVTRWSVGGLGLKKKV